MTFPGTYDISYYKGDTLEFRIYPKDSNGNPFPLSQYAGSNGTTKFTIAPARGTTEGAFSGYAKIANEQTYITCAITPIIGSQLTAGSDYVYDVEIARSDSPYDFVYTLLTGNISVSEQVTPIGDISPPSVVENVTVQDESNGEIDITWSAPSSGPQPTAYDLYIIPYDPSFENTQTLSLLVSTLPSVEAFNPTNPTDTSFTFTQTTAISVGLINLPSAPLVPGLGYMFAVVARNDVGSSSPVGNFNVTAGTIDPVIVLGGS